MPRYSYLIQTRVAWVDGEWIRFEGSQERMKIGDNDFSVGDEVMISIIKVYPESSNANP